MTDGMIRKSVNVQLLLMITPGDKCWEARADGFETVGVGQTPDAAAVNFEKTLREGSGDTRARKVVAYVPVEKVEEPLITEESLLVEGTSEDSDVTEAFVGKKKKKWGKHA